MLASNIILLTQAIDTDQVVDSWIRSSTHGARRIRSSPRSWDPWSLDQTGSRL
ncbi:hypothetical protein CROQUDRAFT_657516 [Cronartium quercuum f. sp. fusiforme G11]|uniref:Uncharacterized protein n=1 Tax=Cronartium quercuum f. sp. fusiforme G11 TaxID=708437 RepID=A0A9P6NIR1_9BASI|nr:hypothetical protein CROQUDRAFT_657516 [Cronartium quercuum f. sp. fusiforme G11]